MIELDKEKLYKLYKLEGWSISALEKEFGVCNLTIKNNLKFYNIVRDEKDKIKAKEFRVQRIRENNLKKYGVDNVSKLKEVREKVAEGNKKFQEKLKAEGKPSYFATEEGKAAVKKAVREKYGVDNINQLDIHRERMRKNWENKSEEEKEAWAKRCKEAQTEESLEKYKRTNLERYNTEFFISLPEIQEKAYEGRKRNGSFITSIEENEVGRRIKEKFPDLRTQYKDERYPFSCDFYIPSLDLFIEYQGYWTHGGEPFNPNNEKHLEIVKHWEERSNEINFKGRFKKAYKNAIETWTHFDVQKRKIAQENKLNWKEFFNKESLINFLDSLKQ